MGRLGRLLELLPAYARTAWWGLVGPRLEREGLLVAQAVVCGEAGVLLAVRSDLRGWELPGGNPEAGETPEDAVVREVREETGLDVEVERHVGDYVRTGFRPHRARVYRCRVRPGGPTRPTPSPETPRVAWFHPDALPEALFPWYRAPVADALAGPAGPVERHEHQGVASVAAGMAIDLRMRWSGEGWPRDEDA